MKNLKRALSFALATVMLIGMMVVGVSAASFGDADEIVNTDAVNTMVALGIIKGKDNGNFDPEGIVTRAEMAKMICVALNGGKDPNLAGGGLYADTKGHWAAGYIDYCTNMGIVSGDTAGNFNPDKTVTGTEAAKMILIALGYSAENEKFVNDANWALNINIVANTKDLYKDLAILPAEGLTRDNAAQMLYNGMGAEMVEYDYKLTTENGDLTTKAIAKDKGAIYTIFEQKFNLKTAYGYIDNVSYNSTDKDYDYTMSTTGITEKAIDFAPSFAEDCSSLFGMKVKVLYKTENSKKVVYGMYPYDSSVVVEGIVNDIDTVKGADTAIKVDGTSYKLDNKAGETYFVNFNNVDETALLSTGVSGAYSFKALDVDGDQKIDKIVVYPFTVKKITYISNDYITIGDLGSKKIDDVNVYEGVAKDDYAIVTAAKYTVDDTITLAKADVVTGAVDAVKGTQVKVNGVWYEKNSQTAELNDTYDFVVVNNYLFNATLVDGTAISDVLYVASSSVDASTATNSAKQSYSSDLKGDDVKVIFTDGTTKVVKAARDDVYTTGTKADQTASTKNRIIPAPGLYTYKVNSDGVYLLKAVKEGQVSGTQISSSGKYVAAAENKPAKTTVYTTSTSKFDNATDKFAGKLISDDAVIFVADTNGDGTYKVITGKALKAWSSDYTTADGLAYLTKSVSGLTQVVCAVMSGSAGVPVDVDSTGYGYVVSSGVESKVDGDTRVTFTVWNGTEDVELTDVTSSLSEGDGANAEYQAGAFVTYNLSTTAGEVTGVTALTTDNIANGMEVAITGFDGKNIEYYNAQSATFKDDDKTVVIYVDSDKGVGVAGGEISTAMNPASGVYVKNAVMKVTSTKVDVVFYDVANKLSGAGYTLASAPSPVSATATYTATFEGDNVAGTVAGGATIEVKVTTSGAEVPEGGKTLTLTLTGADGTTATQTVTFAAGDATGTAKTVYFTMPYANAALTME